MSAPPPPHTPLLSGWAYVSQSWQHSSFADICFNTELIDFRFVSQPCCDYCIVTLDAQTKCGQATPPPHPTLPPCQAWLASVAASASLMARTSEKIRQTTKSKHVKEPWIPKTWSFPSSKPPSVLSRTHTSWAFYVYLYTTKIAHAHIGLLRWGIKFLTYVNNSWQDIKSNQVRTFFFLWSS